MGEHEVNQNLSDGRVRDFTRALLADLRALERMLAEGRFETNVRRIGAEQEMFLVDREMRPAFVATEVLRRINDPRLTTEIARFNLEANLTPLELSGDCLSRMEAELREVTGRVRDGAREFGADVLLAGILPTLRLSDMTLESMTPNPRYYALNEGVMRQRGEDISVHIKGLDEIQATSDNIMLLSSNTSFQVHLQVGPAEFAPLYNWAQAATAPVLAAAVNSPLWVGHRLWQETRLALFQHSADTRTPSQTVRSDPTRVGFGDAWVQNSILDIFREDIARFRVLLTTETDEDPWAVLDAGGTPELKALRLHNGTVWWWNRPCYGIGSDGRAHLRIENRVLPSGPTTLDEMANAAFLIGLMSSLREEHGDVERLMTFDDAKSNFFAAARYGLKAQLTWLGGQTLSASRLILEQLLPLARQGLQSASVDAADIDLYLGTLEERVRSGQTGAAWALGSLAAMGDAGTRETRHRALTSAMHEHQLKGDPVHRWPVAAAEDDNEDWFDSYRTVGQFMSTDLFTVRPNDLVDLAASVMDWRHIRHVPVEDDEGRLVGVVSHRDLLRLLTRGRADGGDAEALTVQEIMKPHPVSVGPDTPTLEAARIMRSRRVGCLPVVENGTLVGIVTAQDFLEISGRLFEERERAEAARQADATGQAADQADEAGRSAERGKLAKAAARSDGAHTT
ncbi:MAG TPA: CBS domain-containing protein [Pyrinomonadaceae bacterium]